MYRPTRTFVGIHKWVVFLCLATAAAATTTTTTTWQFLSAYPRHLLTHQIPDNAFSIDGNLDKYPWSTAKFSPTFVDITEHTTDALNNVPSYNQASVATFYDTQYLYVAAKLHDPYTFGRVAMSHNGPEVPYHDNDFEFFVDPSGSTEFYKEFEMNVNNATYDVNWGVPDQNGLSCDSTAARTHPYLPTCVNTSSHYYAGDWTMGDPSGNGQEGGLKTATLAPSFGVLDAKAVWNVEIAFPLRAGANHGGLLDTDSVLSQSSSGFYNYSRFDPINNIDNHNPLYWAADFARTVHPRKFFASDGSFVWCPLNNCTTDGIAAAINVSHAAPTASECSALAKLDPTMLGSDPSYGCYWEWVLQNLGPNNAYMHRPLNWAYLQFVSSTKNGTNGTNGTSNGTNLTCGNIEFPVRHLARAIHDAQRYHYSQTSTYATTVLDLIATCRNSSSSACALSDINDLAYATTTPTIFDMAIHMDTNASVLNETCTRRPCYLSTITLVVPDSNGFKVVGTINENKRLSVERIMGGGGSGAVPCLF